MAGYLLFCDRSESGNVSYFSCNQQEVPFQLGEMHSRRKMHFVNIILQYNIVKPILKQTRNRNTLNKT